MCCEQLGMLGKEVGVGETGWGWMRCKGGCGGGRGGRRLGWP